MQKWIESKSTAKVIYFFQICKFFRLFFSILLHFEIKSRVRDWKSYGIVQQCGACEPMQAPADVVLEMSGSAGLWRERPNNNSHRKEREADSPE